MFGKLLAPQHCWIVKFLRVGGRVAGEHWDLGGGRLPLC